MSAMNFLYKNVLKPILFRIHPDHVHDVFVAAGMIFGGPGIMKEICKHYAKRIPAVAGSSGMPPTMLAVIAVFNEVLMIASCNVLIAHGSCENCRWHCEQM